MYTAEQIQRIIELGNEWQKHGKHRVYFNALGRRLGIHTHRYGTGNISSATRHGEKISNNTARWYLDRCGYTKFWFDVDDGKFHMRGELTDEEFDEIVTSILQEV